MKKGLITTVVISTLALLVAYVFLMKERNTMNNSTDQDTDLQADKQLEKIQFSNAKEGRYNGNYSSAIETLRELIVETNDKEQQGLYRIFLAESLYARAQNNDVAEGLKEYKNLVNDQEVPYRVRSAALNGIAGIVLSNDTAFYKTYFYEQPFGNFLQDNSDGKQAILDVYLKILEYSDSLYGNSFAKYAIAGNYYASLVFQNKLNESDLRNIATKIQKYVEEADKLVDEKNYSEVAILQRLLNRSRAISMSGMVLDSAPEEREMGYKVAYAKALEFTSRENPNASIISLDHFIRYNYAGFLVGTFDDRRNADIKELLSTFVVVNSVTFAQEADIVKYLLNIKNNYKDGLMYERTVNLSKISPEFNAFLLKIGFF